MRAAVILTLFGLLSPTSLTLAAANSPIKIMVFGDSLSAAYGILPEQGWVALMRAKLAIQGVSVVNASISGETTLGGLSRLPADLATQKPNIVIIELGANDGLRGLPVAHSRQNLEAMIKQVKAANALPVLIGMQIPPNYGIEYAQQFRDQYSLLSKKHRIPLIPFLLAGFADKAEKFQADKLHPTAAAQPLVLNNVLPTVLAALKSVSSGAAKQLTIR